MVSNCNNFYKVQTDDSCATVAQRYGVALADFYSWNPAVGKDTCKNLWANTYVCVGTVGSVKPTSTVGNGNGIATPAPTQPGMVNYCKRFYKTTASDTCDTICAKHGLSFANFLTWNVGVGLMCNALWANTYCCVGV
jgi:hypothetical protein